MVLADRWRYSLLLQRDQARDTLEDDANVDVYAVDFRVQMFF